jgi:hypothetical protein
MIAKLKLLKHFSVAILKNVFNFNSFDTAVMIYCD